MGVTYLILRRYFNPRSPYGERRLTLRLLVFFVVISIHAPLTGSDPKLLFYCFGLNLISIHAPLTGSDFLYWCIHNTGL